MKRTTFVVLSSLLLLGTTHAQMTFNRIDTTLKIGKVGYRVDCRNKNTDQNQLTVKPVGFQSEARDMSFVIRGRVLKAEIDDLNNDGNPDLVLTIYMDSTATYGTVYAFVSDGNKAMIPCILPDLTMDGKMNAGYKGHDKFTLMEGTLLQKFPVYKPGDAKDSPTGGNRVLQYRLVKSGESSFKFSLIQSFDTR